MNKSNGPLHKIYTLRGAIDLFGPNGPKKPRAPLKVSILCRDHLESLKWPHLVIFKGWFHNFPPYLQHRYINSLNACAWRQADRGRMLWRIPEENFSRARSAVPATGPNGMQVREDWRVWRSLQLQVTRVDWQASQTPPVKGGGGGWRRNWAREVGAPLEGPLKRVACNQNAWADGRGMKAVDDTSVGQKYAVFNSPGWRVFWNVWELN